MSKSSPKSKTEALNFLLPHIRRIPSRIARDAFAIDAAQALGIDSALVRAELKDAAAKRRGSPLAIQPSDGGTLCRSSAAHFLAHFLHSPCF